MMVEGEFDQALQRLQRRQVLNVQLAFSLPDRLVRIFERAEIETFLVAEIVVDHPLAGARAGRNLVDTGARQPVQGELFGSDLDDILPRSLRIMRARSRRLRPAFGLPSAHCHLCSSTFGPA